MKDLYTDEDHKTLEAIMEKYKMTKYLQILKDFN